MDHGCDCQVKIWPSNIKSKHTSCWWCTSWNKQKKGTEGGGDWSVVEMCLVSPKSQFADVGVIGVMLVFLSSTMQIHDAQ